MRRKKGIKLHPAWVFLILTIIVMIISSLGNLLNLEAHYSTVNSVTGDLNTQVVTINNLSSAYFLIISMTLSIDS